MACQNFGECAARVKLELTDFTEFSMYSTIELGDSKLFGQSKIENCSLLLLLFTTIAAFLRAAALNKSADFSSKKALKVDFFQKVRFVFLDLQISKKKYS